jgi:hypothetical protein
MNSRVFIPFRIIFIVFLHFPFFFDLVTALSLASLCCGRCFTSSRNFLSFAFSPLPTAPSTPWWFSFLSSRFFVVCLVGGGGHVDVGGQLSLDEAFVVLRRESQRFSPSRLYPGRLPVRILQDTLGERAWISVSPNATPALHFSYSLPNPNPARPSSSLHPISLRYFRRVLSVASFFRQFPLIAITDFQKCLENEHITFIFFFKFFSPLINRSKDPPTPTSQSTLLRMARNSELCMFSVPRTDVSSVLVFDE